MMKIAALFPVLALLLMASLVEEAKLGERNNDGTPDIVTKYYHGAT